MEAYARYTGRPPKRMRGYEKGIEAAGPGPHAVRHYRYASSDGVESNFRDLTIFPSGTDAAYEPI
ncbi:uncharacterized protein N7473_006554 [Penicillium subrubescens]|uniref:Uncharacterized protein n=1 Tax=Penicillium subrubescens TaxID=1316194 RepID=A0A1Q5TK64_9EURO|nr:uncharacterized protein N7473_006554 [Penicillium subrubescens]KAJ5890326.1 hypothetical protein N7473_006554 [Penicillium subrubescens]OKP00608.1 hypothetical protein PENSUB_7753 [Penicillium subrubescens]